MVLCNSVRKQLYSFRNNGKDKSSSVAEFDLSVKLNPFSVEILYSRTDCQKEDTLCSLPRSLQSTQFEKKFCKSSQPVEQKIDALKCFYIYRSVQDNLFMR